MTSTLGHTLRRMRQLPVLSPLRRAWYESRFTSATEPVRLFRGVFPTFKEAVASTPAGRLIGFDNDPAANRLADDRHRLFPSDYPVLFWLTRLLPQVRLVFDLGGNVGISYYAYSRYLSYPDTLTWLVHDVPAVVSLGRDVAQAELPSGHRQLRFTSGWDELRSADLVIAAASLQFLDDPTEWLRTATTRPRWIIINKTPLTDEPRAATLHAIGPSYCGYHLFNRREFLDSFHELGYRVIDRWSNADVGCEIPFYPQYNIPAYTGMLLELTASGGGSTA